MQFPGTRRVMTNAAIQEATELVLAFMFASFPLKTFFAVLAECFCRKPFDTFVHLGAGLERDYLFRRQHDRFAGVGMVDPLGSTISDFKDAELTKLDTAIFDQPVNNRVKRLLDRFPGQRLGDVQRLGDLFGNFLFRFHCDQ